MIQRFALMVAALAVALPCLAQETAESFTFSEKQEASRYIGDFRAWLAGDAEEVKNREALLAVGSSSMRGWRSITEDLKPLTVLHRGFGGSTIGQVLLFKDFFLRYEARDIMIYEGDNDLNGSAYTPESFVAECREFCASVWALRPDTRFHFLSIKPSPRREAKWPRHQAGNALLQAFSAEDARVFYIDVATPMLGEDGKALPHIFLKDNLHLNAAGYEIWTKVVRAALLKD